MCESSYVKITSFKKWFDEYLTWDTDAYDNITHMTFPAHALWTPHDITAVNT